VLSRYSIGIGVDRGPDGVSLGKASTVFQTARVGDRHQRRDSAKQAREIDPQFPVVYMSGAHAEDWPSKGVPNSIMLAKPFAPAQLVIAVSQLLNASPPTE
jgi:hypothetical protein